MEGDFVQSIQRCQKDISKELNQFSNFITALEQIVAEYENTENKIIGNRNIDKEDNKKQRSDKQKEDASDQEKKDEFDLDEWTAEKLGISEETWETIKFILGFIPIVNVGTDIYQLVDDLIKVFEDGKVTWSEARGILVDIVFLGIDFFSAKQIVNGLKGVTKAAKAAKTKSKVASKTAEELAKKAEKAASKSGGTVKTTKAAKKATKAANKADKATKAAEAAAQASKEANKEVVRSTTKEMAKGVVDNISDEYGTSGKFGIPYTVIREERDKDIAGR